MPRVCFHGEAAMCRERDGTVVSKRTYRALLHLEIGCLDVFCIFLVSLAMNATKLAGEPAIAAIDLKKAAKQDHAG